MSVPILTDKTSIEKVAGMPLFKDESKYYFAARLRNFISPVIGKAEQPRVIDAAHSGQSTQAHKRRSVTQDPHVHTINFSLNQRVVTIRPIFACIYLIFIDNGVVTTVSFSHDYRPFCKGWLTLAPQNQTISTDTDVIFLVLARNADIS
ncbi:hypothetical protein N879_04395 [Alcaligenes sp. EGD-AK7]|nr:hypothetical protein C660_11652 [Alcaligenes sp. HPC1271]ERI34773.1 hypothetical protein N879_04395 [Alcaligenes sp. EGD-AK7]